MTAALSITQKLISLALLAAVVAFIVVFPVGRWWLAAGFVAYALLLGRAPRAWLVVVPAALPVLDLAFFSGWYFFDEFDALVLVTLAVLMWRRPLTRDDLRIDRVLAIAVALLVPSYIVSAAIVLTPWPAIDGNSFAHYYSPFNALRVAKGFVWPLLLLPFVQRAVRDGPGCGRLIAAGLALGLLGVSLVAVYERWLFVGLFNFGHEYRVSGPFSSMHAGDGHIDLWLATTIPLIAAFLVGRRHFLVRLGALGLGALGLYVLLATASRGPFLAVGAAFFVLLGGLVVVWAQRGRVARILMLYPMLAALAALAVVPFVIPTQLGARFHQTLRDSQDRLAHYREALAIRDPDLATRLIGMGLGTFPRTYDRRHEGRYPLAHYSFDGPPGRRYLTLQSGDNLYISQPVAARPHTPYLLSFTYRTTDTKAALTVPLCELWLITSFRCAWQSFKMPPTGGRWKEFSALIRTGVTGSPAGRIGPLSARPVRFVLFSTGAVDGLSVDNVSLVSPEGRNLIRNGDFSAGFDYWFWTADNHLAWHTKNLVVNVLFDQGWFGVAAVAFLLFVVVVVLCRAIWAGRSDAVPWFAALIGYLVVAQVSSPFDQPRIAMLLYLICFFAVLRFRRATATVPASQPEQAGSVAAQYQ